MAQSLIGFIEAHRDRVFAILLVDGSGYSQVKLDEVNDGYLTGSGSPVNKESRGNGRTITGTTHFAIATNAVAAVHLSKPKAG